MRMPPSFTSPWRLLTLVLVSWISVSHGFPGRKGNSLSEEVGPPALTKRPPARPGPTPPPAPSPVAVTPAGREADDETAQEPPLVMFQPSPFTALPMAVQLFGNQRSRPTGASSQLLDMPRFVSARERLRSTTPSGVENGNDDLIMMRRPTVNPHLLHLKRRAYLYHRDGRFLRWFYEFNRRTTPASVFDYRARTKALARRFIQNDENDDD